VPTAKAAATALTLILVRGITNLPAQINRRSGFTLIELLVVLVIGAMLTSMVAMSVASNPGRDLRFEAERLGALLSLAREEAQVRGGAIRFEANDKGYRFVALLDREWQPIPNEPDLRERAWQEPTEVKIERVVEGKPVVEFGRDSVDAPFKIRLTRNQAQVVVSANGLGNFQVD
jgi:general secretion pathway protein H